MPARHYAEPGFTSHACFMEDDEYGRALDSLVISCVDLVLVNGGKILLGKRDQLPQKDWWIIGGRMRPGESFEETAQRNAKRELNLDIAPERFSFLTVFSTVWSKRAQSPQENGTHTISTVMFAVISNSEKNAIVYNDEYSETQWVSPEEILEGEFHGAVKQCAQAVLSLRHQQHI